MAAEATVNLVTYGLLGGTLLLAAGWDIQTRRIPNQISLFLIALFVGTKAGHLVYGADIVSAVIFPMAGAIAVFTATLILFRFGLLGGGDAKLLSTLSLFTPLPLILPMLWIMAVSGGLLALVTFIWSRLGSTPKTVPYGVAIMLAGLWVCSQTLTFVGGGVSA